MIQVELKIKYVCVSQSCLTLCNPMDCSPPGSSVHGILQVRLLDWVAFPQGIEPGSPALQADSLPSETPGKPKKRRMSLEQSAS